MIWFLRRSKTHDVDQCSLSRHWATLREAITAVGATIRYLPAYSPDLDPIEMAFLKLKAALRKGAKRTVK
jgi:transposase